MYIIVHKSIVYTSSQEKKDNRGRTGTAGGKDCKLTEVDNIILDIVGKESPVVEGLCVGESGNYEEMEVASPHGIVFEESEVMDFHSARDDVGDPDANAGKESERMPATSTAFTIKTKKRKLSLSSERDKLLEAKWKAQTELLQQQAYNFRLQNYKMELELGLEHTELTSSLQSF